MREPERPPSPSVNELLDLWKAGDRDALNALVPQIYKELHGLAHFYLQGERSGHTLQTSALINETYLRLAQQGPLATQNREHLIAVSARLMRQILVDYARSHGAIKRGAAWRVELVDEPAANPVRVADVVAVDDALTELTRFDPQQSLIVELRFFGGLTVEETAAVMGISVATVGRAWSLARSWLTQQLRKSGSGTSRGG